MKGLEDILKNAGGFQKKIEEVQSKLEKEVYEGSSGGGMVKVILDGKANMKKVIIDSAIIKPDEKEIIEDLVIAAFNDAKRKVENAMRSSMADIVGGMPVKFPF